MPQTDCSEMFLETPYLFTLLDKEFYLLLLFYFFLDKSSRSILSTLSIWSFKMFSSYPLSMKFCFIIAQCILYSVSVERMVFTLFAWIYNMLFLSDLV